MELREYFEQAKGIGVLATADAQGKVNVAVYARPHFLDEADDNACAFVMSERVSHDNVKANPMRRTSSSRRAGTTWGEG